MPKVNGLTIKQKLFAQDYIKTLNGTKSALKYYDVKNNQTARVIASENLAKPYIKNYIEKILKESEYNPVNSIKSVMSIEEKARASKSTLGHSLKASEILLKISSVLVDKSQHLSLTGSIDNLDTHELLNIKKKYNKLLED